MSALHWICALTLALLCSISAQPVKRSSGSLQLLGALKDFKSFTKNNCSNETLLYSLTNIHKDCLASALNCTIMELNVLGVECGLSDNDNFNTINDGLNLEDWNITPSSNQNCSCELYNQTDVEHFLNNTIDLVERLYSRKLIK